MLENFCANVLNSVLTRQTSEKVAFKSGFDNLLEYFLPTTFARIISVWPQKFQNFPKLGGGGGGCSPPTRAHMVKCKFRTTKRRQYL